MTGARVEVTVDDDSVTALWRRLAQADELRTTLSAYGEHLLESHAFRWELEVSPDLEPWAPLSEPYRRRKLARKGHDRILELDGFLKDTLSFDATDTDLRFGTNRIYGATHQFGDADRGIPARPFLGLSDDDLAELDDILQEHIDLLLDTP